jgi:hypothetical protein
MKTAFRIPSSTLRIAASLLILCGCMVKDKPGKDLKVGGMTPPWDPAKFTPKSLETLAADAVDSAFAVFKEIARVDSQSGDEKGWKADPEAIDTLRIAQLFDTAFVFPASPEASEPYGYDDSFRDDTLFRNAYGNGLYTQDHPCAATFILSGGFPHPAKWLRTGMKMEEVMSALGKPLYRQDNVLRYLAKHPSAPLRAENDTLSTAADYEAHEIYEGVNFYFASDSLFAAVLQKSQPCH